jgi:hypothetical protein
VFGALLYGFLTIAYGAFYNELGINPEDIGLTYVTTFTRSAGLVAILLLSIAIIGAAFIARKQFIARSQSVFLDIGPIYPFTETGQFTVALRRVASLVIAIVATVLLIFMLRLPAQATNLAMHVKQDRPVAPIRLLGLTMLAVRAERAHVTWINDPPKQPMQLIGYPVLYLGQADGNAVFWDPRGRRTVVVPVSNLLIEIG